MTLPSRLAKRYAIKRKARVSRRRTSKERQKMIARNITILKRIIADDETNP